jgi:hypothetical protein
MKRNDSFTNSEFRWFHGIVEDIGDPLELGRVKVRCYGYHTDNLKDVPTNSLPWAHVMLPVTSASISNVGQSATGILNGTFVIGFFRDGIFAQEPVVIGTIASFSARGDYEKGFTDPDKVYPIADITKDMPKEASTEYYLSDSYDAKAEARDLLTQAGDMPHPSDYIQPEYPNNKVIRSRLGHVIEIDDTDDADRVSVFHRSGAYVEILTDGRVLITSPAKMYIASKTDIRISAEQDVEIVAGRDLNISVGGNTSIGTTGNTSITTTGTSNITSVGTSVLSSGASTLQITSANTNISASGLAEFDSAIRATGEVTANYGGSFVTLTGHTHSMPVVAPVPNH